MIVLSLIEDFSRLIFNEMMMMKTTWHLLYFCSPNWQKQQSGLDMSLHSVTFSWFRAIQLSLEFVY